MPRRFVVPTEGGYMGIYADDAGDAERRVRRGEGALVQMDESTAQAGPREPAAMPATVRARPVPSPSGQRPGMSLDAGPVDPGLQFQQSSAERPNLFDVSARGVTTGVGGLLGGLGGGAVAGPVGAVGMAGVGSAVAGAGYDLATGQGLDPERSLEDAGLGMTAETLGVAGGAALGGTLRATGRVIGAAPATVARVRSGLARLTGAEDPVVAAAKRDLDAVVRLADEATAVARSQQAAGDLDIETAESRLKLTQDAAKPSAKAAETAEAQAVKTRQDVLAAQQAIRDQEAATLTAEQALTVARQEANRLVATVPTPAPAPRGPQALHAFGKEVGEAIDASIRGFRLANDRAFRAIDEAVGGAPVVQPTRARDLARDLVQEGRATLGVSPEARKLAQQSGGVTDPATAGALDPRSGALPFGDLSRLGPTAQAQALEQLLGGLEQPMTWRQARMLEAQLGEAAYGPTATPFGTLRQGQARRLYRAVRDDIDEFLKAQGGVNAALDTAKAEYRRTRTLANSAFVKSLRKNPDAVLTEVFKVGPDGTVNVSRLQQFREVVPGPVYQQAAAGYVARLFDRAHVAGRGERLFSPSAFVKSADPLLKGAPGQDAPIDLILDTDTAAAFRAVVDKLRSLADAEARVIGGGGAKALAEAQGAAKALGVELVQRQTEARVAREAALGDTVAVGRAERAATETRESALTQTRLAERAAEGAQAPVGPAKARLKAAQRPVLGLKSGEMERLVGRVVQSAIVGAPAAIGLSAGGPGAAVAGAVAGMASLGTIRRGLNSEPVVRALTGQWTGAFGAHSARAGAHIIGQPAAQVGRAVLSRDLDGNVRPTVNLHRGLAD